MAVENRRGCGYRKVGGLYLVGGSLSAPCDRLPYPLHSCPVCGGGIHFSRAPKAINPLKLFGTHDGQLLGIKDGIAQTAVCQDKIRPCFMCDPTKALAYLMMVGEKSYTPQSFTTEAKMMGVCKRISAVPKGLKLGKTIIYLAHPKAIYLGKKNGDEQHQLGIFSAFIPKKVEKLVWESQLKGKKGMALKKQLKKQGITPVTIPNGDKDHDPNYKPPKKATAKALRDKTLRRK